MSEEISRHQNRIPIWVLHPREEKQARENLKTFAYKKCDEFVSAFVACAKEHKLKTFPACNELRDKMGECLLFYQQDKYLDAQRDAMVEKKIEALEEQVRKQKETK